jgi:phospholipid:diacylglycerol acyltransferase
LLSSGYMCAKGWKQKRYNPAGVKVVTYEMKHEPDRFNPRGGPNTGEFGVRFVGSENEC